MEIINLTPHDIKVDNGEYKKIYPKSGIICRVDTVSKHVEDIDGFKVNKIYFSELINYPNKKGELYIVSSIVGFYLQK